MEDVITNAPPPSRFLLEDLNIFSAPSPPLPSPFIVFSSDIDKKPLCPSLLIISISSPSLYFIHSISSKTLIGSLVLPEISFTGNSIEDSLKNKSCNIYAVNDADHDILSVSVQYPVTAERSHAIAKLLVGGQIIPDRVLILDSVQSHNFRGKLSREDTFALKLETTYERNAMAAGGRDSPTIKGVDYFPSGSMVDGLGAALLAQCQLRKIKGTLCVSWPEHGVSVRSVIKSILLQVLPSVDLVSVGNHDDVGFNRSKDILDSELYT